MFKEMDIWWDGCLRGGFENMGVDEWLLGRVGERGRPLLRFYGWEGEWCSMGVFTGVSDVDLEEGEWVRRMTGGGVVDHREGWTYSLMIPAGCEVLMWRAGEVYRRVHEVLAGVLDGVRVLDTCEKAGEGACFVNPVRWDLVGGTGEKVAGAAQRRTKQGLLHQGSVLVEVGDVERGRFARGLAERVNEVDLEVDVGEVAELVRGRYGSEKWLYRH